MSRFIVVKNWGTATYEDIRNWANDYGAVRNVQMQSGMAKVAYVNPESAAKAARDVGGRPRGVFVDVVEPVKNPPGAVSSKGSIEKEAAPLKVHISVGGDGGMESTKRLVKKSDDSSYEKLDKNIPLVDLTLSDEENTSYSKPTPLAVPVDYARKGLKKSTDTFQVGLQENSDESLRGHGTGIGRPTHNLTHGIGSRFKETPLKYDLHEQGKSIVNAQSFASPKFHHAEDHGDKRRCTNERSPANSYSSWGDKSDKRLEGCGTGLGQTTQNHTHGKENQSKENPQPYASWGQATSSVTAQQFVPRTSQHEDDHLGQLHLNNKKPLISNDSTWSDKSLRGHGTGRGQPTQNHTHGIETRSNKKLQPYASLGQVTSSVYRGGTGRGHPTQNHTHGIVTRPKESPPPYASKGQQDTNGVPVQHIVPPIPDRTEEHWHGHQAPFNKNSASKPAMRPASRNVAMQSLSRNSEDQRISYKILSNTGVKERVVATHVSLTAPEFYLIHEHCGRTRLETLLVDSCLERISRDEALSPKKVYALKVGPGYKRVLVLNPFANGTDSPLALVQLIDSGEECPAAKRDLCHVPRKFAEIPPLALKCSFSYYVHKTWDKESAESLAALIISDDVALTAQLTERVPDGLAKVVLRDQEDNDVAELLGVLMADVGGVDPGVAKPKAPLNPVTHKAPPLYPAKPKALFARDMPINFDPRRAASQTFTFSASDTRATVYMQDEGRLPELRKMEASIGGDYLPVERAAVTEGMLVLAVFVEDGLLYRATVLERFPGGSVGVRFIDYGERRKVGQQQLFYIPADLAASPAHAVKMRLWHVDYRPPPAAEAAAAAAASVLGPKNIHEEHQRLAKLLKGRSFGVSFVHFASTGEREPVVRLLGLGLDSDLHFIHSLKKKLCDANYAATNYGHDMAGTVRLDQQVAVAVTVTNVVQDGETVHVVRMEDLPLLDDVDAVGRDAATKFGLEFYPEPGEACMIALDGDFFRAVRAHPRIQVRHAVFSARFLVGNSDLS